MQDNVHDQFFTDHAWEEMHKVLDREMPERKRRGLLFWILPAFGLSALLCSDTLPGAKVPVAATPNPIAQPIASNERLNKQSSTNENRPNPINKDIEAIDKQAAKQDLTTTANPVAKVEYNAVATKADHLYQSGRKGASTSVPDQVPIHVLAKNNQTSAHLTVLQETNPAEQAPSIPAKPVLETSSSLEVSPEHTGSIQSVPVVAIKQTRLLETNLVTEKMELYAQKRKQRLEWWTEASTQMTNGVNGLSGFRVGILAGIPIGRIRLFTGLGFENTAVKFQSIERNAAGQESRTMVTVADRSTPAMGATANQNVQTFSSINLELSDLNVALYHPIGKKFGLTLGGAVQYVHGIRLGNQYVQGPLFANAGAAADVVAGNGNFLNQGKGTLSKIDFRNFGFAVQGKLVYRLAPRWNANLDYRYSVQHLTKSPDFLLKPNWIDVGLMYRIR